MGHLRMRKKSTHIDMTAMSDVTVLLLTFFMLTSSFVKKEPVKVQTPASVSEIKIPETDILQLLVDMQGRVFISMDRPSDLQAVLRAMGEEYGVESLPPEGIPADSAGTQLKAWVRHARAVNPNLRIAIKADAETPYAVIRGVMNSLRDLRENRYHLITSLKTERH